MTSETLEPLQRYAETGSDEAFRLLVERHAGLVYGTALRKLGGDAHLAQDVTQLVFCDLARQARKLPRQIVLAGWLYRSACLKSAQVVRTERRRNVREQRAAIMQDPVPSNEGVWQELAPLLDEGLSQLSAGDRDAVLLRFFQNASLRAVGETLGLSEDAAQKRVSRALERLRSFFGSRGVVCSSAALAAVLAAQSAQAALPAGLVAAVTAGSLAGVKAGATVTGFQSLKTFGFMIAPKFKAALIVGAVAFALTLVVLQHRAQARLRQGNARPATGLAAKPEPQAPTPNPGPDAASQGLREQESEPLKLPTEATHTEVTHLGQPSAKQAAAVVEPDQPKAALPALGNVPGGYVVVLDETPMGQPYQPAAEALAQLRAPVTRVALTQNGLAPVFEQLQQLKPKFVAFVVPPRRIEDNFVGEVFERASRLEGGPELDFAWGYVTGATPRDALALVRNTARAEQDRAGIAKKFVAVGHTFAGGDLGPFATEQARLYRQYGYRTEAINPIDNSAGWQSRLPQEMRRFQGASLVFFAGHGMGDRLCGVDADAFSGLQLDRAIVVNGTCHSAVTTLRHDNQPAPLGIKSVSIPPERSVCLRFITAGAVAQLGSTASSCWMNVAPAIDGFFHQAKTVGEALRDRLNDHIRRNEIRRFSVLPFKDGQPSPQFLTGEQNPGNIQSMARVVLIGDPAYRPFPEKRPVLPMPRAADRRRPTLTTAPLQTPPAAGPG